MRRNRRISGDDRDLAVVKRAGGTWRCVHSSKSMMVGIKTGAVAMLGVLLIASCGQASESDPPAEPPPAFGLGEIRYSCSGPPGFLSSLLDQEPNAELESHPSAEALRQTIREGQEADVLPAAGYWLVSRDASSAQYIARGPGGVAPPFVDATLNNEGGAWKLAGWGQCQPTIVLDRLSVATWTLDPELPPPDAGTTTFTALVTERACTGGQPMLGRLLPPSITYGADTVSLVFAATPLAGDMFECPGNPSTRVTVELREALGDRRLVDGAFFPPADPTVPVF